MARMRRGEISSAIIEFLRSRKDGASLAEIQKAVDTKLGVTVSPSSIRSYLNKNVGTVVDRIGAGRYRLH